MAPCLVINKLVESVENELVKDDKGESIIDPLTDEPMTTQKPVPYSAETFRKGPLLISEGIKKDDGSNDLKVAPIYNYFGSDWSSNSGKVADFMGAPMASVFNA